MDQMNSIRLDIGSLSVWGKVVSCRALTPSVHFFYCDFSEVIEVMLLCLLLVPSWRWQVGGGGIANQTNVRISWPVLVVLQATYNYRLHSGIFSCRYFFYACHFHSYNHAINKLLCPVLYNVKRGTGKMLQKKDYIQGCSVISRLLHCMRPYIWRNSSEEGVSFLAMGPVALKGFICDMTEPHVEYMLIGQRIGMNFFP